ncbi:MAG TPA: hypothetical protein VGT41_02240 [Candidatus Babeliales bacterium]|nr:hypothetical protein [Candidatus Babeliales bacterium]
MLLIDKSRKGMIVLFVSLGSFLLNAQNKDDGIGEAAAREVRTAGVESSKNIKEGLTEIGHNIQKAAEIIERVTKDSLPQIEATSSNLGRNFGLGVVEYIGEGITGAKTAIVAGIKATGSGTSAGAMKGFTFLKATGAKILAVKATPYIVGAGVVGGAAYGSYKLYRHVVPTEEETERRERQKRLLIAEAQEEQERKKRQNKILIAEAEARLARAQTILAQEREKMAQAEIKAIEASILLRAKQCEHQKTLLSNN